MKTFFVFIILLSNISFAIQVEPDNLSRKLQALEKFKTVVLPDKIVREVQGQPEVLSDLCVSQNERISSIDPTSKMPMDINIKSYLSLSAMKTVLILPPTGGVNDLDFKYAESFCEAGLNSIIILSWTGDSLKDVSPQMHDENALRAVASVRSLLQTIDPNQNIGILGTSVGGIIGSLVIGLEKRIQVGLFIVAGAGMTEILAESTEQNLSTLRDIRTKYFKFETIGDYYELLDKTVFIDPIDFVNFSGDKKVGFILSTSDTTVPTKNQYDLINAWGGSEVIFKTGPPLFNHLATIIHSSIWWTDEITAYLSDNL